MKFFFILWGFIFLFSCTNESTEDAETFVIETKSSADLNGNRQNTTFVLVNKEKIEKDGISKFTTSSSAYESSLPIYRYLFYSSAIIDHLYTDENSSKLSHDNRTYTQENQFFNLMPDYWGRKTKPLYRHYSSTSKIHKLSLDSHEDGFSNEGLLGHIFYNHEVGTVPLEEYYSSKRNSYLYTWSRGEIENALPSNDPDFVYNKTIGYVYPGNVEDALKRPTKFILKGGYYYDGERVSLVLTVNAKEKDSYWKLTYSAEVDGTNPSVSFPINNTYTVVSADLAITNSYGITNTFTDITNPLFEEEQLFLNRNVVIILTKKISEYDVTYEFYYDVILGTE